MTILIAMALALVWQTVMGSAFALLWNLALAGLFELPAVSWLQGIGLYWVLRLVLAPPDMQLKLKSR